MERSGPVLVIDDSAEEIELLRFYLNKQRVPTPVRTCRSAEEAVAYLQGTGVYADRKAQPLPVVVFIDLKMPGMDGFHFLQWMKDVKENTPRVVLSSSV